jgi:superfamily II DNA or RNA helicase
LSTVQLSLDGHAAREQTARQAPALPLRPYQAEAIDAVVEAESRGVNRPAVVLPCGTGKTVAFAHLIARRPGRALVIAHRDELLEQAKSKLRQVAPTLELGIVKAERDEVAADVVMASIQTIARPSRLTRLGRDFTTVIIDECHHSAAPTYVAALEQLGAFTDDGPLVVGFTATLERADNAPLGAVWQEVAYERGILWMIANGYLCDLRAIQVGTDADLAKLKIRHGDLQDAEIAEELLRSGAIGQVAGAYVKYASDRRGLAFTPTVETAYALAAALLERGISAEALDGTTHPDARRRIVTRLQTGETQVGVNCGIFTEGTDLPATAAVLIARPTRSRVLYCLDAATEILTDQGWRGIDDDLIDARAAGFDQTASEVRWTDIVGRVERPLAPGEGMYRLNGPSLDIRITDQHRMVWRNRQRAGRSSDWRVATAAELASRRSEYEIPIAGVQKAPGVPLTDDEIRFIGWYMTDGTRSRTTNQVSIVQAEHQPYNEAIRSCLVGCGFKFSVYRSEGRTQYSRTSASLRYAISKGIPRGRDKHLRGWGALEPYLDKSLAPTLEDLDARQLGVLLEAMHLGDGSKQNGQPWTRRSYHITTANRTLVDRLQSLCVRRGFKCNIAPIGWNQSPAWMLHIKATAWRHVGGSSAGDRPTLVPGQAEPGERVWCVETGTGTLITRRNGKVAVLGNCQMVGRGTRLHPGKDDCLVLDLAGVTARHDLATVAELAGLDPAELEGKTITEALAVRQARGEEEEERGEGGGGGEETLRLPGITVKVPMFRSKMRWLTVAGEYVLPCDNGAAVHLVAAGETYRVEGRRRGREPKVLAEGLSLEYAQGFGEDIARRFRGGALASADASWRAKPPSPKQLAALKKWRIRVPKAKLAQLTAGDLSDLINTAAAKAAAAKAAAAKAGLR